MIFEYDLNKSNLNLKKHGIDFECAKILWQDPERLEIPARIIDEERYLVIGLIGSSYWSAVVTYRNDSIRIISVRRARNKEVKLYESI